MHKIRTREKIGYNEYDQHKLKKKKAIKNLTENKQKSPDYEIHCQDKKQNYVT